MGIALESSNKKMAPLAIWRSSGLRMAFRFNHPLLILSAILLITGLAGCSTLNLGQVSPDTPFVPPTIAVRLLPTATAAIIASSHPTATPTCQDNLAYLSDLTVPDGTVMAPGSSIDKRWQVENSGSCNWDEHYHLKLTQGPDLGASPDQPLYPARAGTKAAIRILFTAPSQPGTYRSAWQAYSPDGKLFGDPIFIEIVVNPS